MKQIVSGLEIKMKQTEYKQINYVFMQIFDLFKINNV